jgi:hypothetical protein
MTTTIDPKIISIEDELPSAGRSVIVVCRNVQVPGYLDGRRVWHEEQPPHRKLEDVVGWYDDAV